MNTNNFNYRFLLKYLSNAITGLFKLITELIIPKLIGVAGYGAFTFIRDIFLTITTSLDLSFSESFFQISSKYQKNYSVVIFHSIFITVICALLILLNFILFIFPKVQDVLFPSQIFVNVLQGSILAFAIYLVTSMTFFADSKKYTVNFEIIRITCTIIFSIFFLILVNKLNFNIENVFNFYIGYNLIIFSASFIFFYNRLKSQKFSLNIKKFQYFKKKYLDYSIPLIQANIFVALFFIFDRWFLQYSYGDLEQGYFGIAFRLSLVITLIATSFYPIFRQNISVYFAEKKIDKIGAEYKKIFSLFLACSFLSFFFIFNIDNILEIINLENEFKNNLLVISIMLLYPVHQILGLSTDAVFLSMEKTKLFRTLRILLTLLGFVLSYVFLAPKEYLIPGLQLGAMGLALKMVLGQFLDVHVRLFYTCKLIRINFFKILFKEISLLICVFLSGFFILNINEQIFYSLNLDNPFIEVFISFFSYLLIILIIIYIFPNIIFLKKDDFNKILNKIIS